MQKKHTLFIQNGVCESLLTKIQHLKEIVTKNKFFFRQHKYLKELRFVKCDMKAAKLIKKKSTTTTTATTMNRGRTQASKEPNKNENRKQIIELNEMTLTLYAKNDKKGKYA